MNKTPEALIRAELEAINTKLNDITTARRRRGSFGQFLLSAEGALAFGQPPDHLYG